MFFPRKYSVIAHGKNGEEFETTLWLAFTPEAGDRIALRTRPGSHKQNRDRPYYVMGEVIRRELDTVNFLFDRVYVHVSVELIEPIENAAKHRRLNWKTA